MSNEAFVSLDLFLGDKQPRITGPIAYSGQFGPRLWYTSTTSRSTLATLSTCARCPSCLPTLPIIWMPTLQSRSQYWSVTSEQRPDGRPLGSSRVGLFLVTQQ